MQRRQSSTFAWPTLCAVAVVAMLFGALADQLRAKPAIAALAAAPFLLAGPALARCPSCGWIEAKREIVPQVMDLHALKIYEYTLRMADGSVSVFQETLPTS